MDENKKELIEMLNLERDASWARIYEAIGMLKEKALKNTAPIDHPWDTPLGDQMNRPLHYHNGQPCWNDHCVWC